MSPRKKQPSPAACGRVSVFNARKEGRYWDAILYGAQVYHHERLWHMQYYQSAIKMAEQMRAIVSPQKYEDEIDYHTQEVASWTGETGVRLQIGRDLEALHLESSVEAALVHAIAAWSEAGGVPDQLPAILAPYRDDAKGESEP